jgi:NADH-quinone oxidoreductase subunit E
MTDLLPEEETRAWHRRIAEAVHPRELAVDVMFAYQERGGWLSDLALEAAADLLGLTTLELEELATFYPFIYRRPVGRYVIHVCDSLICWMNGYEKIADYLSRRLSVAPGETTADGLFSLLPVCCIGYCDRSPAMLINKKVYGELTPEKIDRILDELRRETQTHP